MQTAELRRLGAERLLSHLVERVPKGTRGKDIPVETTLGGLLGAINGDAVSGSDPGPALASCHRLGCQQPHEARFGY